MLYKDITDETTDQEVIDSAFKPKTGVPELKETNIQMLVRLAGDVAKFETTNANNIETDTLLQLWEVLTGGLTNLLTIETLGTLFAKIMAHNRPELVPFEIVIRVDKPLQQQLMEQNVTSVN